MISTQMIELTTAGCCGTREVASRKGGNASAHLAQKRGEIYIGTAKASTLACSTTSGVFGLQSFQVTRFLIFNMRPSIFGALTLAAIELVQADPFARALAQSSSSGCFSDEYYCNGGCIPLSDVCCSDGNGSCLSGYYCIPSKCCPVGEICTGSTSTTSNYFA
jgi:hypothetical protein